MGDHIVSSSSSLLLPPGWTSHISPAGRTYYHNSASGISTYTFPAPKPPRREKPVSKSSIPNTSGWLKVTTNKDNVFYFHPETKRSEWLPPQEVVDALKQVEEEEERERVRVRREEQERVREEREKAKRERLEKKRKAEEGVPITEFDASKRARADDDDDDDESEEEDEDETEDQDDLSEGARPADLDRHDTTSNAQLQQDDAQQHTLETTQNEHDDDDDDEEEAWQRQIAEQMAAEAEAEAAAELGEERSVDADNATQDPSSISTALPPSQPQPQTLEEQKSAFLSYLTSLNTTPHEINPMAPYDLEQSKFSHHPSFLALPTREGEDTFNEWCKLRIREKRAAKAAAAAAASSSSNSAASSESNPSRSAAAKPFSVAAETSFRALLKAEVRSTRTKFSDFSATFSHDPRYSSFGRSDADREKLFKQHLIQLGEEKRRAAQAAESNFLQLLSDRLPGNYRGKVASAQATSGKDAVMQIWMQAKRTPGLIEDKRYDAVGSSTTRFELFTTWAKGERRPLPQSPSAQPSAPSRTSSDKAMQDDPQTAKSKAKEEARRTALREREEKVARERSRIERANRTAFSAATREDSLLSFRQLLLDAVHSAHTSYDDALPLLRRDARFDARGLTDADRTRLFEEHSRRLADREGDKIGRVFSRYATSLDMHPEDVLALTLQDVELSRPPLSIFAADPPRLRSAYDRWDAQRREKAESAFQQMLHESAFVEFWGRLKKASQTQPSSATADTDQQRRSGGGQQDGDDDDEEGEQTTLVEMARKVDLAEIESVLRNDARFRAWRHEPEQRRRWIRDHLQHLAAPSKSVHR